MPPSSSKKSPLLSDTLPEHHKKADEVQAHELAALMKEVAQAVDYSQFRHLSVDRFSLLLRLARYDQFSDAPDPRKARWLAIAPQELLELRSSKDYPEVVKAVRLAFAQIVTPRSFKTHLEDTRNQDLLYRRMRLAATTQDDLRNTGRLMEKLAEATVPRAAASQQAVIIQISEEHAKLIADTLEEVRQIEAKTVDAQYTEIHTTQDGRDEGEGET